MKLESVLKKLNGIGTVFLDFQYNLKDSKAILAISSLILIFPFPFILFLSKSDKKSGNGLQSAVKEINELERMDNDINFLWNLYRIVIEINIDFLWNQYRFFMKSI